LLLTLPFTSMPALAWKSWMPSLVSLSSVPSMLPVR